MDLVDKLKAEAAIYRINTALRDLLLEAAAEIDRLDRELDDYKSANLDK